MKKLLVLQLSLFIYSNSLKEKTMEEKVGVPAFSFFSFKSIRDSFVLKQQGLF